MGFTDSNDDDDEDLVLMIVLVWKVTFLFAYEAYNMFIITFQTAAQFALRFSEESDVSS